VGLQSRFAAHDEVSAMKEATIDLFGIKLTREVIFWWLLFGWVIFAVTSVAFWGSADAAFPDWRFHLCYAQTLNAHYCASGYNFYMPLVHLPAFALNALFGSGVLVPYFVLVLAFSFAGIAILLQHYGGWIGFLGYFGLPLPAVTVVYIPHTWVSLAYVGLAPFVFSLFLFLLLLYQWRELSGRRKVLLIGMLILSHNWGVALAGIVAAAAFFGWLLGTERRDYLALVMLFFGYPLIQINDVRARLLGLIFALIFVAIGRFFDGQNPQK
jgi:hypothetical protein